LTPIWLPLAEIALDFYHVTIFTLKMSQIFKMGRFFGEFSRNVSDFYEKQVLILILLNKTASLNVNLSKIHYTGT